MGSSPWKAARAAVGRCRNCPRRCVPGRKSCAACLRQDRLSARRRYQARPRRLIAVEQVIEDVRAIAQRLACRRVSLGLYLREGSYCWSSRMQRRFGMGWPAICARAGLLATPYSRGLDRRPCRRCGRICPWYAEDQRLCHACRWTVRRRKYPQGWQEDVA